MVADILGPEQFAISATGAAVTALVAAETAMVLELFAPAWMADCPVRIATLGAPDFALALDRELAENGLRSHELTGWIDQSIGDPLRDVILANEIDLVVRVSGPRGLRSGRLGEEAGFESLLDLPVRTIGADQLYENLFGHVPMGTIDSRWYLYMLHPEFTSTRPITDRAVELAIALPALAVAAPFLALAALAIKLEDGGSVLYRQTRIGAGGEPFEILKLRTMGSDAQNGGAEWSRAADVRVTRVGRILRRPHIDELPQLLNVLRGEMTIVGPRPEQPAMVEELERIFPHYSRRHLIKPGVTGWAQVRCGYAGSTLGSAWKLCHDLYYLKRRSRLVNLMIIFETLLIAGLDSHRPLRAPQPGFLFSSVERSGSVNAPRRKRNHPPGRRMARKPRIRWKRRHAQARVTARRTTHGAKTTHTVEKAPRAGSAWPAPSRTGEGNGPGRSGLAEDPGHERLRIGDAVAVAQRGGDRRAVGAGDGESGGVQKRFLGDRLARGGPCGARSGARGGGRRARRGHGSRSRAGARCRRRGRGDGRSAVGGSGGGHRSERGLARDLGARRVLDRLGQLRLLELRRHRADRVLEGADHLLGVVAHGGGVADQVVCEVGDQPDALGGQAIGLALRLGEVVAGLLLGVEADRLGRALGRVDDRLQL